MGLVVERSSKSQGSIARYSMVSLSSISYISISSLDMRQSLTEYKLPEENMIDLVDSFPLLLHL